jgi:hypothetical protein
VHLGSSDYLRRYKIFVSHAQGWRQQFQKLESVDLRYDNQIIVNPDMAKPAASKLGMAKTAAMAGVKPVSLLTRVGPNERPIPKPAFELAAKKLDPKPAAGSAKKAVNKAKAGKDATFATYSPAGEKKLAPIAKAATNKGAAKRSVSASTHRTVERRKIIARSSAASSRSTSHVGTGHVGGRKPSPAIAKGQTSAESSD